MSHVNSNYKEYNENRAAELFEELGNSCADTPLLRMNAKVVLFRTSALLSHPEAQYITKRGPSSSSVRIIFLMPACV